MCVLQVVCDGVNNGTLGTMRRSTTCSHRSFNHLYQTVLTGGHYYKNGQHIIIMAFDVSLN